MLVCYSYLFIELIYINRFLFNQKLKLLYISFLVDTIYLSKKSLVCVKAVTLYIRSFFIADILMPLKLFTESSGLNMDYVGRFTHKAEVLIQPLLFNLENFKELGVVLHKHNCASVLYEMVYEYKYIGLFINIMYVYMTLINILNILMYINMYILDSFTNSF